MKKTSTQSFQWETHHNLFAGIGIILAVMIFLSFVGCGGGQQASEETTTNTEAEDTSDGMSLTEEDIQALKDKFIFDETTNVYYHKHWNKSWPKRRTLTVDVRGNGGYYVCSNFYGNKGIKHDKIIVKIGEEELESEAIDLKNENEHRTDKTENNYVYEVNYYTRYRDKGIFDAIAKSEGNVQISFIGGRSSTEFEDLPASDLEAIRECHKLSLILRVTGG